MLACRQSLASVRCSIRRQCRRYNSTAPTISSARIYCQNLLQKFDYPSYLQTPFFPSSSRDAQLAIRALNVELALIPETVANQDARIMRMQFWKDVVDNSFQGCPKAEPVSILLAEVLASGTRLTKSFFNTIISERVCPNYPD
jgi:NADH dehydrogenase [ubiquinone] 1 alpha subcomplex assembly factor 6